MSTGAEHGPVYCCSLIQRNQQVDTSEFDPNLLQEQASIAMLQHLLRYDTVQHS